MNDAVQLYEIDSLTRIRVEDNQYSVSLEEILGESDTWGVWIAATRRSYGADVGPLDVTSLAAEIAEPGNDYGPEFESALSNLVANEGYASGFKDARGYSQGDYWRVFYYYKNESVLPELIHETESFLRNDLYTVFLERATVWTNEDAGYTRKHLTWESDPDYRRDFVLPSLTDEFWTPSLNTCAEALELAFEIEVE